MDKAEWSEPGPMINTLLVAYSPSVTDLSDCEICGAMDAVPSSITEKTSGSCWCGSRTMFVLDSGRQAVCMVTMEKTPGSQKSAVVMYLSTTLLGVDMMNKRPARCGQIVNWRRVEMCPCVCNAPTKDVSW